MYLNTFKDRMRQIREQIIIKQKAFKANARIRSLGNYIEKKGRIVLC